MEIYWDASFVSCSCARVMNQRLIPIYILEQWKVINENSTFYCGFSVHAIILITKFIWLHVYVSLVKLSVLLLLFVFTHSVKIIFPFLCNKGVTSSEKFRKLWYPLIFRRLRLGYIWKSCYFIKFILQNIKNPIKLQSGKILRSLMRCPLRTRSYWKTPEESWMVKHTYFDVSYIYIFSNFGLSSIQIDP